MNDDKLMQLFFSGDRLYGDDLSLAEIEQWYVDEGEGYANLGAGEKDSYRYVYHALNQMHGFAGLDLRGVVSVLGFGSAYGEEPQPVLRAAQHIMVRDAGLIVRRESLCVFPPLSGLVRRFHPAVYNSVFWTRVDAILSRVFRWNLTYHATSPWRKFRPTSAFFVLQKSDAAHGKEASNS